MSGFVIYILVSVFTPGPNNIFASASSSRIGVKKTLPFMFGVLMGTFLVFVATGYFNVYLYENVRIVNQIIGILGGLFILYLAIVMYRSRSDEGKLMIQNGKLFTMAVLLTLINPKALIFGLTVATYYLQLGYPVGGMLPLAVINAVLCFLSVLVWGSFGQMFRQFLTKYRTAFNIVMALLLAYSGILIILESVSS